MFESVLIANRGEIACRIMRTARRLGVRTVAIYSDADARARHVAMADSAYRIGPAPARESYLRIEAVIEAARRSGARAIHPGYGFLSENAEFAEACARAGVTFIGPPAAAIRAMGSKSAAKKLAIEAGVPVLPGYNESDQDPKRLVEAAKRIGFPVLIKAVAGGGGKGMRLVEHADQFASALEGAQREALASFGDGAVLIEKYLARPRHVELQVFADRHGGVVHLHDRDCSLQRRHQKVVEEAPAPGLSADLRRRMGEAGVALAKRIGYVGAGTIEFLVEGDGFHFMEMNTRLQVEHPVTEMICGVDLVEWQFRIAAGERLPLAQDRIAARGHAIEVRLYAENPARGFLPSSGRLSHLRLPAESPHVRVDTGAIEGDTVSPHYDPMIAKIVSWDADRTAALRQMRAALAETQAVGPATNLSFLQAIAAHEAFARAEVDTGFIPRHEAALIPAAAEAPDEILAVAALHLLLRRAESARIRAAASADPHSPWHRLDQFRINHAGEDWLELRDGKRAARVGVRAETGGWRLTLPGGQVLAHAQAEPDGGMAVELDGRRFVARAVGDESGLTVLAPAGVFRLALHDPMAVAGPDEHVAETLAAPLTGRIVKLLVKAGERVSRGQPLVVLDAMKMEHTLTAGGSASIAAVNCGAGEQVREGDVLIRFAAEKAE
ncbi:MAG: acetyl/propionyl/methylcrotonyl-CoA carboxylase subunit alpha [Alphaproteobacteria bacterium]|nr:acetyl/propionyl/methylcrotonyl-CoA carboxylase subunit alpha [Alphaproteobacteria bacterium]